MTTAAILFGVLVIAAGFVVWVQSEPRSIERLSAPKMTETPRRTPEPRTEPQERETEPEPEWTFEELLAEALAPMFEHSSPSKESLKPHSWTVRRQENSNLYSVVPFDKNGIVLWRQAVATDIEDPIQAWHLANVGRHHLSWVE